MHSGQLQATLSYQPHQIEVNVREETGFSDPRRRLTQHSRTDSTCTHITSLWILTCLPLVSFSKLGNLLNEREKMMGNKKVMDVLNQAVESAAF